ncbi:MAG: hypothetical protein IKY98_04820, partial [Alphaproteobacteria bacterium]|nr:hypothetical protein [Alphaproteobacteria bacterium]
DIILPPHIINKYNTIRKDKTSACAEFYVSKFMPKEVSHETLNIQIRHLERDILSNNSPETKFLRLYAIVHTLNNLGYDELVGVPNIDNLPKQFDDLQSSPDKWDNLINKLGLFSEELANGSDKTDIQLACLFNKPVKELTDDDRLIGYLSENIYHTNTGEQQKFAQMFIQKLEENGYDPQKISDIIFNNVEYDDNGNEIIQDISFPKNKIKAGKILRHLDKNYDIETLRLISIKGEKYFEQYTPQYRQPYFLAGSDHIPIMFYSEYEAKKYIQEQENKQPKQTDNLKETQTTTQSNRLSKILSPNSEQTIPSSNITQNNNNCVTPPIVPSQQTRGILNTNLRDELSILTERPEAPKTPQQNISSPSHNKGR